MTEPVVNFAVVEAAAVTAVVGLAVAVPAL